MQTFRSFLKRQRGQGLSHRFGSSHARVWRGLVGAVGFAYRVRHKEVSVGAL